MNYLLFVLISVFSAIYTVQGPVWVDKIEADLDYLIALYQHLHRNPEISLEEMETAQALKNELEKIGFTVTDKVGGNGIVGIYKNGEGPTLLYRTDMDALPMYEKTDLPYSSQKETNYQGQTIGTMHSCGHDMHMTTWIGTARNLIKLKDQWSGTLMWIGQPAEEIGAGAKMMLDAGLYERFGIPDFGLGLHCSPTLPAGEVGFGSGYTMANAESIDIKIFGVGAHGAAPHKSIDPVVIASMIVMDLQTIVSRNLKPTESAVVTVGAIKGGIKHNIIPDEVTLQLTVRTFTEEVRQMVHRRIREICKGIALAAGLPEDKLPEVIIPESYTPANYNHPELTKSMRESARKIRGADFVKDTEPQLVAEDFARYGQTAHKVPTVLYWLGTVPKERIKSGELPGLHSPFYYPQPRESLLTGIAVNTQIIMDLLRME